MLYLYTVAHGAGYVFLLLENEKKRAVSLFILFLSSFYIKEVNQSANHT